MTEIRLSDAAVTCLFCVVMFILSIYVIPKLSSAILRIKRTIAVQWGKVQVTFGPPEETTSHGEEAQQFPAL